MTVEMSEYLPRGPDMAKGIPMCVGFGKQKGSCLFLNDGQTER